MSTWDEDMERLMKTLDQVYRDERRDIAALMRESAETDGILKALRDPLGLAGSQLPPYGVRPPYSCERCHSGPLDPAVPSLCIYCAELARISKRDRPALLYRSWEARDIAALLCAVAVVLGICGLTGAGSILLVIAGILAGAAGGLITAALILGRRHREKS